MSNTQNHTPGTWELSFIESALNAYWHYANNELEKDNSGEHLGDWEKTQYQKQREYSRELMQQIDERTFYLQAENEQLKKQVEVLRGSGQLIINDWEERMGGDVEVFKNPANSISGEGYYSPTASMLSSSSIANLRKALEQTTSVS